MNVALTHPSLLPSRKVFYFLWANCLVAFTFFLSTLFRSTKTAVVCAFLYTFATGLIGWLLLTPFIQRGYWWYVGWGGLEGGSLRSAVVIGGPLV